MTERVWINLHEVEHIFMEGGDFLIASGILSVESLILVRDRFDCFEKTNVNESNQQYVEAHVANLVQYFEESNQFMVGHYLGFLGSLLCTKVEGAAKFFA